MHPIHRFKYALFICKNFILQTFNGSYWRTRGVIKLSQGSIERNVVVEQLDKGYTINEYENLNSQLLNETNFQMKPFNRVKINDGRLITDLSRNLAIFDKKNYIIEEVSFTYLQNSAGVFYHGKAENNSFFSFRRIQAPKRVNGVVFSLLTGGGKNFNIYHWFFDSLSRLYAVKDEIYNIDYFLVPEYVQEYQIESLKYLGINKEKVISSIQNKHIIANELICTSHPRTATYSVRKEITCFLREKFHSNIESKIDKSKNYPTTFYISRKDAPRRKVKDEELLIVELEKISISTIEISSYTFDEIVYLFKHALMIISTHSAALTNILLCKTGTKIIECSSKNTFLPYYSELAKSLDLEYQVFFSQTDELKNYKSRYEIQEETEIFVNIPGLINHLNT